MELGFGFLPKNVEVLYLDKKSPQYEWIWDLGGLATKCRGIIPRQKSPQYEWSWDLGVLQKCEDVPHKKVRNMSGFGIWVVLPTK